MVAVLYLTISALLLLSLQKLARHSSSGNGFFSCEAFVLANWAFVFLHGVVLYFTGGKDWGALSHYSPVHIWVAAGVVALGLASFVCGGWIGAETAGWRSLQSEPSDGKVGSGRPVNSAPRPLDASIVPGEHYLVGLLGLSLTLIGGLASLLDTSRVMGQGLVGRSSGLLVLSQLLVPGAVFSCFTLVSRRTWWWVRPLFLIVFLGGIVSGVSQYSRRPLIVAVACSFCVVMSLRHGYIKRRHLFLTIPALWALAAVLLMLRRFLFYQYNPEGASLEGLLSFYADRLWIETSAFGGLMYIVKHFGVTHFLGGESFAALLFMWIPRSIFPSKPEGFDLVLYMDYPYPYNLPPTIYGELLINFTLAGIIPPLLLLGFFMKRLDLRVIHSQSTVMRLVYFMFVFDIVFVVRGSFTPMVYPLLLHAAVPILGLVCWQALTGGMPSSRRVENF